MSDNSTPVQQLIADMRKESSNGLYSELSPLNTRAILSYITSLEKHPGARKIVVVSADVDDTLTFELHVTRTLSSDELNAIGESLIAAAGAVKKETKKTS